MGIVCALLQIYILAMAARFVLSWFPPPRSGFLATVNTFLFTITEPVLRPARAMIPPLGAFDLSATLVLFLLIVVMQIFC
jgi:YggT family protein